MKDIHRELLEILKENGYAEGDITENTYIYENSRGEQVAIERPDDTVQVDTDRFRPHSIYITELRWSSCEGISDVEMANKMIGALLAPRKMI